MEASMKLIPYLRVSSAQQVEAWGLDRQDAVIRAWAKANGHRLLAEERDEGKSGTLESAERPGLSAGIERVNRGDADGIVVADLDRFARKLTVQETALALVWKSGGHVFSVTGGGEVHREDPDDPSRNLIRQVMGAVIEYEKNMSVMRMRHGKKAKRTTGRKAEGQYAYGYQSTGTGRERDAGPEPEQQAVVRRIVDWHNAGQSYRQICDQLNTDGVKTKHGRDWVPMTVKRIYDREAARRA
jgi:DNA invertase Pin-like site-specific DNA recombinase